MGFNQFSLALVVVLMMTILLKPNCGRAAVLVKSNTTYQCNSLLNGCRIGDDLQTEMEFFMGSDVIRILADGTTNGISGGSADAHKKAIRCPYGEAYGKCLAPPPPGKHQPIGTYTRRDLVPKH